MVLNNTTATAPTLSYAQAAVRALQIEMRADPRWWCWAKTWDVAAFLASTVDCKSRVRRAARHRHPHQ
jgi:hypothetical protein